MIVVPVLFLAFAACAVQVSGSPQNDLGFPDGPEDIPGGTPPYDGLGNRQGFRPQQGFRPRPVDNFRPPGGSFGPPPPPGLQGSNFGSPSFNGDNFGSGNSFPQGSQGNSFRPQGSQGNSFRPQVSQGNSFRPQVSQGNSFRPQGSQGFQENNFGAGSRPNNLRPNSQSGNGVSNSRPNNQRPNSNQNGNNFGSSGNDFTNSRPNNQRPNSNQNGNNFGSSQGVDSFQTPRPDQTQTSTRPSTSTTASAQTTTRIPPRDPTNRIVYIVSCPCQFTRQYAPVCGTDGQTYGNLQVLRCAQQCGTDVQVFLMGACGRNNG